MRIDSHQHFWIYNRERDSWITDAMQIIQRNFLPADLKPVLQQNRIDGCVAVQADQSETETQFLIDQAKQFDFIKGVVGWVDLKADDLESRLEFFQSTPVIKGFRHVIQGEGAGFMLQPKFIQGVKALGKYNFTYDILIKEPQLEEALEFVKQVPHQKLVIDHIAKPKVGSDLTYWRKYISSIAQRKNVYCKLSGMVTEADWNAWQADDFKPYLDTIFDVFGSNRVMYGSDWPVCLVAAGYEQQLQVVTHYIQAFTESEKQAIMGANAIRFYNL
jgi:L-fuconolactonase